MKIVDSIPLIPLLEDGELALTLTWGDQPVDMDIHVEFLAGKTLLCRCDFTMQECGGVEYLTDTTDTGYKGADIIKFNWIGDF